MNNQILYFKLSSGEEFFGEVIETTNDSFIVKRPAVLMPGDPSKPQEVRITPWQPTQYLNKDIITVHKHSIAIEPEEVLDNLKDGYIRATSNIQIAPAGLLKG